MAGPVMGYGPTAVDTHGTYPCGFVPLGGMWARPLLQKDRSLSQLNAAPRASVESQDNTMFIE